MNYEGEAGDTAVYKVEALVDAHFVGFVEHELHPHTDAQEGDAALHGFVDGGGQMTLAQPGHAGAKRPHTRQHQLACFAHHLRVFR